MDESAHYWENKDPKYWRETLAVPLVRLYGTIPSTNDIARGLAEHGAPHLTVVVADHQTQGRGRGGKSWLSTPGSSLLCSVILRYETSADAAPGAAPVRVGHAVAGAIQLLSNVETRVKWPNDVVIAGHGKVAGILCEGVARADYTYLVAGIGINLGKPGAEYVAIADVSGQPPTREAMLREIVARMKKLADVIARPLSDDELAAMRRRDILFGQLVEDENGLSGRALGIARDGSLLLQTTDGLRHIHNATIRLAGSQAYPGARS